MSFLDKFKKSNKKGDVPLPPPPAPGSVDKKEVKTSNVTAEQPFELPPLNPSLSGLAEQQKPSSSSGVGLPSLNAPSPAAQSSNVSSPVAPPAAQSSDNHPPLSSSESSGGADSSMLGGGATNVVATPAPQSQDNSFGVLNPTSPSTKVSSSVSSEGSVDSPVTADLPSREQVRSVFNDVAPVTSQDPSVPSDEAVKQLDVDNLQVPRFEDVSSPTKEPNVVSGSSQTVSSESALFSEGVVSESPLHQQSPVLNSGEQVSSSNLVPSTSESVANNNLASVVSGVGAALAPASTESTSSQVSVNNVSDDALSEFNVPESSGVLYVDVKVYENVQKSIQNLKKQLNKIQDEMSEIKKLREGEDNDISKVVKKLEKIQRELLDIDADLFEE